MAAAVARIDDGRGKNSFTHAQVGAQPTRNSSRDQEPWRVFGDGSFRRTPPCLGADSAAKRDRVMAFKKRKLATFVLCFHGPPIAHKRPEFAFERGDNYDCGHCTQRRAYGIAGATSIPCRKSPTSVFRGENDQYPEKNLFAPVRAR